VLIIGISGLIGSGKSEVAKRLIACHGFERAKFATGLKLMLRTLLVYRGVSENEVERYIEGDLKELPTPFLNGRSPRHAMITLGTEWGREQIHPDLWVDTEVEHISAGWHGSRRTNGRILFDDVRFPNELTAIRRLGGSFWRVERPGLTSLDHESEQLQAPADFTIFNDGTLEELFAQVDATARAESVFAARRVAV